MSRTINILCVGGYWSTNVGNAFYELGIKKMISNIDLNINFCLVSDLQKYKWTQYNSSNAGSINICQYYEDIDYLLLSGPMLNIEYMETWKDILKKVQESGTKVICMSAGGSKYTKEEIQRVREILQELHLYGLFSRDHETFKNYKDLFEHSYDGICCAFFIPEYFTPWKINIPSYVVFDFETYCEPIFVEAKEGFDFVGDTWNVKNELKVINRFGRLGAKKNLDIAFHDFNILRPKNTCFEPRQKKYHDNNIYVSDVPTDYLNIYANAVGVFSDRVHACVAALSQGIPTMFFGDTPRANLFERILRERDIHHEPVKINVSDLDIERQQLRDSFKEILS